MANRWTSVTLCIRLHFLFILKRISSHKIERRGNPALYLLHQKIMVNHLTSVTIFFILQ